MNGLFCLLLAAALLATAIPSAFAAENVAELKIEEISPEIVAGEMLEFSYLASNRVGSACSSTIVYWFESEEKKVIQGSDTIYLAAGESRVESASLVVPIDFAGVRHLYLKMSCNDANILASRAINVSESIPRLPLFKTLDVLESEEGKQVVFSYALQSETGERTSVFVEETILKDNNIVWSNSQKIAVAGSIEIERLGPLLQPGSYKIVARAASGIETAKIERDFSISPALPPKTLPANAIEGLVLLPKMLPAIVIEGLVLLLFAGIFFAILVFARTKPFQRGLPAEALEVEEPALQKKSVCLAESEASGVLDIGALEILLDEIGYSEGEKPKAIDFASTIPVIQIVKSCLFTEEGGKMSFETAVVDTVVNNSNRDWLDVAVIAMVPDFLGKISGVTADTSVEVKEEKSILRFTLGKIGAKQSASIAYAAPKLISQEEVGKVSLPAVIGFKEGRRLKLKKIMVKRKNAEMAVLRKTSLKKDKPVFL